MFALVGGPVKYLPVFDSATAPVESGVLLHLLGGVRAFLADVRLFFVLRSSQYDLKLAYLAPHRSRKVNWEYAASFGWFPNMSSSSDVPDILAREIVRCKKTARVVQVKKWVGVLSFVFEPGHLNALGEATDAVIPVVDSSDDFPDPDFDAHIVEDETVEEDLPLDLRDLSFSDDRRPSALQQNQEYCGPYGLTVRSDVQSDQGGIRDSLVSFASTGVDGSFPPDLKEFHAVLKENLEKSLAASEDILADEERRMGQFEHNMDTPDEFAIRANEAQAKLNSSGKLFLFFENKAFEQSSQLVKKDTFLCGYRELVIVFEKDSPTELARVKPLTTQHTVDKRVLDDVRTALALQKTALQHRVTGDAKHREK